MTTYPATVRHRVRLGAIMLAMAGLVLPAASTTAVSSLPDLVDWTGPERSDERPFDERPGDERDATEDSTAAARQGRHRVVRVAFAALITQSDRVTAIAGVSGLHSAGHRLRRGGLVPLRL